MEGVLLTLNLFESCVVEFSQGMILPSKDSQVLHRPDVDQNNAAFKDALNDPTSDKNKKNSKFICNVIKLVQSTFWDFNQGLFHSQYKLFTALFRHCKCVLCVNMLSSGCCISFLEHSFRLIDLFYNGDQI